MPTEPEPTLPAASVQVPASSALVVSGPAKAREASQVTPWLVASVPEKETSTGWLNQPFESAARESSALTEGAVASYLNACVAGAETLPAPSTQVPETEAAAVSGPLYGIAAEHVTGPLVASAPVKATVKGALCQPLAPAGADGVAVAVGAVASSLKVPVPVPELPAASVQVPVTEAEAESGPL